MRTEDQAVAYLWDMLNAAQEVLKFTKDFSLDKYLQDLKVQRAVERSVEIIGEAARRISDDFKSRHNEIPWHGIISQRHVLAHEYGEIKQELMWELVTTGIPELISLLEPLIPPSPE
jgi:uncharacterized protein with HEPN domain